MSNNYKDASARLAEELKNKSFNQIVQDMVEDEETIAQLADELVSARNKIEELDTEPLVVELREQLATMETVADTWVSIANDLFDGLLLAEEQLVSRGIGLRPAAQEAKKFFIEMTEDDD